MPDFKAPGVEIKCDGTTLTAGAANGVVEVMVENRLDLPGAFSVTLADSSLAFIDSSDGPLHEGVRLEIGLGYDKKYIKLLTGEISTITAEMSPKGTFATVSGFDLLHRLARGTAYRRFGSGAEDTQADSLIAYTLINEGGLKPVVDETHSRSIPRTQDNRSDLDFLFILARLNGYYLYSEEDRVFFTARPPDRGELNLTWGDNLSSFYPRLSLNGLVKKLEMRGKDSSLDESFAETLDRSREDLLLLSSAGRDMLERGSGGHSTLNLYDALVTSAKDAKPFLAGLMREQQGVVTAVGSCVGDPALQAGTVLKLTKVGRFGGSYLVTRAVHRLSERGYTTEFEARMTP
jgi:phage protein D